MSKNIIVFSDGTGQEGGHGKPTNVYKTFNLILDRSERQISFYDQGLGTGWRKATGNIAGRGFARNVKQCYEFVFENYRDGDRIFLFGFSRGAATVRSLTGFLHLFGVLPKSREKLIDEAWKIYKIRDDDRRDIEAKAFVGRNHTMWAHVEFLGVWDTVAALGLPETRIDRVLERIVPHGFHDFRLSQTVKHARHAVAIDDERRAFHPVLFDAELEEDQTLRQVWFMGMHTDVGGGYAKAGLSDIAFEWMLLNAVQQGLRIYPKAVEKDACLPDPDGHMHDSRDTRVKRWIFKKAPRRWERDDRPVIHESVRLRTSDKDNNPNAGYSCWLDPNDPEVEPWTHVDQALLTCDDADVHANLLALQSWCRPIQPAG